MTFFSVIGYCLGLLLPNIGLIQSKLLKNRLHSHILGLFKDLGIFWNHIHPGFP